MAKADLSRFSKTQENGNRIIMEASLSQDKELKAKAERILNLFKNASAMMVLELDLELKGKNMKSGAFFLARRDILATVGTFGRIPKKGERPRIMPTDFWTTIKNLETSSSKRINELSQVRRQNIMSKKPIPKKPIPKKAKLVKNPRRPGK